MDDEKIGLAFTPAQEGDFLFGLPARDLTEAEVAYYQEHEPGLMRNATAPNPATGKALYQEPAAAGKRAARRTTTSEADETPPTEGGEA